MRTLVLHASQDLRMQEQATPAPGANQVAVRIGAGGICGSDLHYYNHGGFGAIRLREPMILGHEIAGTVVEIGVGVSKVAVGSRVGVNPSRPCHKCRYCLEGMSNQCLDMHFYGSAMRMPHVQGAFREVLICEAEQCEPARNASVEDLALAEPFAVVLHGLSQAGSLLGKRVLVTGCGPIGTLAVAAARLHGAAEIVATDVTDEPLVFATRMGADRTINTAIHADELKGYAVNKGSIDVMLECSGNERALRAGIELVRPRGIIVQLGLGGDVSVPQNAIVAKELTIRGSFRFGSEYGLAVRLIDERRLDLGPLVSHRFPIEEATRAFETASDRRQSMKVQLAF